MTPQQYQRLRRVFEQVYLLPDGRRAAALEAECGSDLDLRREVEVLLAHSVEDVFLEPAGLTAKAGTAQQIESALQEAQSVGDYQLLELVGEGGMGVVYRARHNCTQRVVALKLLRAGLTSDRAADRFEREARVLARMTDPHIAQLYEYGVADLDGSRRPFLAMEYVDGIPVTDFAASHDLSARDRLDLIAAIADAVHHAHQRGVIHRDIKPANVLVAGDSDASGNLVVHRVKVLDFGVARLVDEPTSAGVTVAGQLVGTLAYMSPEQIRGGADAVDTRSDVYSLGVIGYELSCGRLPYALHDCALPEISRRICEHQPEPAHHHDPALGGDVTAILAKALQKSPQQRYASAAEFSEDIRRHLRFEPIVARSPSIWYYLNLFARRRRAIAAGIAIALMGVLLGLGLALRAAQIAAGQRDRALDAEQLASASVTEAQRLAEFLQRTLAMPAGDVANNIVTLAEVLDAAAARVDQELADLPRIAASVRLTIANAYMGINQYERANEQFTAARADLLVAQANDEEYDGIDLAEAYANALTGQFARAEQMLDALYVRQIARGASAASIACTLNQWAEVLAEKCDYPEAIRQRAEALAVYGQSIDVVDERLLELKAGLATLHDYANEWETAIEQYRELLDWQRAYFAAPDRSVAWTMYSLGFCLRRVGELDAAEGFLHDAWAMQRELWGERHVEIAHTIAALGDLAADRGDYAEAEGQYLESLAMRQDLLGERHLHVAQQHVNLGRFYARMNRLQDACDQLTKGLEIRQAIRGDTHPQVAESRNLLEQARKRLEDPPN